MISHPYFNEKSVAERHQQIQQDMLQSSRTAVDTREKESSTLSFLARLRSRLLSSDAQDEPVAAECQHIIDPHAIS